MFPGRRSRCCCAGEMAKEGPLMAHVYRADTIGSLLRPPYLKLAREQFEVGQLESAAYVQIEDRAVDQAIAMQEGVGLDVVTDGELRRHTFIDQLTEQVEGLSPDTGDSGHIPVPFHDEAGQLKSVFTIPLSVTDKLRRRRMMTVEEYAYARARARRPVKVTLPSLLMLFLVWSPPALTGRVQRPVRPIRRRSAADEGGGRGAREAGLPLHPGRCAGLRPAPRSGAAGLLGAGRHLGRPGLQRGHGHAERARLVNAVRLRLSGTGQRDQRGRPGEQAAPRRRGRGPRLADGRVTGPLPPPCRPLGHPGGGRNPRAAGITVPSCA